jgi:cysteinyl-tRNA synthetase
MRREQMKQDEITIKLYDTLQASKVVFIPREEKKVNMYVCGLTPSNYPHIGHARTAVIFDVIQRIFMRFGYQVQYCSNFTDIDDKIIARSKEEGCTPSELAEKYIQAYLESMKKLNIKLPTCFARVTQHIPEIIEIVETLIEKGFAYESEGDVYFRVRSFKPYGKLSKRSTKELLVGARIEPGEKKQDPLDFALWKAAKEGEPFWESPWGKGRPGWHIECSAMSLKYLGNSFDIHGGAQDLIFPHHENEIAQAEAYSGIAPFSKYWIHAGWVTLNKEKMSKSIGNVFRLSDALSLVHPNVLRFFFISTLYSSPLDYDVKGMNQANKALERIVLTLDRLKKFSKALPTQKSSSNDLSFFQKIIQDFDQALSDNFNTPQALSAIMIGVKEANCRMDDEDFSANEALEVKSILLNCLEALGFFNVEDTNFAVLSENELEDKIITLLSKYQLTYSAKDSIDHMISLLIAHRNKSRDEKSFQIADEIRLDLNALNIYLEDSKEGTKYRISEEIS